MKQFEYLSDTQIQAGYEMINKNKRFASEKIPFIDYLNMLGKEGWEIEKSYEHLNQGAKERYFGKREIDQTIQIKKTVSNEMER